MEHQEIQKNLNHLVQIAMEFSEAFLRDEQADKAQRKQLARGILKANNIKFEYGTRSTYLKNRFEIFKRDDFKCVYCGRSPEDGVILQVDHVSPRKHGGSNDRDNLVTACFECNIGKRDFLLNARHEAKFCFQGNRKENGEC